MNPDSSKSAVPNFNQEFDDFVALMEQSIDPTLLASVEEAYLSNDKEVLSGELEISYEGTTYA
ncbi:MAG: hypothetical protein D3910_28700 [Candidatus Electrothrix sp. ATG2]|nr:hypothetical protein [Candidatus Electrothrix sp. ATG2]